MADGAARPGGRPAAGPLVHETNAWTWLGELARRDGRPVTLATIPGAEWDRLAGLGFDAVWLMGVWERSPAGVAISLRNEELLADFRRALPDFTPADDVGSPYCVRRYRVDDRLGGPEGLAAARAELAARGLRLILDFVPNHVAPDHPWTTEHPEFFIRGDEPALRSEPGAWLATPGGIFACGRDPYFPPWPDVLQLDAFSPGLRAAVRQTLLDLAGQCDGLRCDMAMLTTNPVFERTWGARAGARPADEYWPPLIEAVRRAHPGFLFVAEAYWDLEWELQGQGFDHCYDKRLYDRLVHAPSAEAVQQHVAADPGYQAGLARFIENHDEPRAAATLDPALWRAAAVAALTLPGLRLVHEGQAEGRRIRLPVFLGRRPEEPDDLGLRAFYGQLLPALRSERALQGSWRPCERGGWPDNDGFRRLVAWCWRHGGDRCLVVANLSTAPVQARVRLPWEDLRGRAWVLTERLGGTAFQRDGDELAGGLYVELPAGGFHLLAVAPAR